MKMGFCNVTSALEVRKAVSKAAKILFLPVNRIKVNVQMDKVQLSNS